MLIDSIAHYNKLRGTNPKLKVLFALFTLLVCVLSKSIVVPIIVTATMIYLTLFKAEVPRNVYMKLLLIPVCFGALTLLLMIFMFGYEPWFSFNVLGFEIIAFKDGFGLGMLLFWRMVGGVTCTLFLALTTPFTELFYILKEIKIPESVLEISMMMYRYIFVLFNELIKIENAQKTRLGYSSLKNTYKSLGILAGSLFIKTWDKSETLHTIMNSRGYDGNFKLFGNMVSPKTKDLILVGFFELFLIALQYSIKI